MELGQLTDFFEAFRKLRKFILVALVVTFGVGYGVGFLPTVLKARFFGRIEDNGKPTESVTATDAWVYSDLSGAVQKPGIYRLPSSSRISDLVSVAGGFSKDASIKWVATQLNLSEKLTDAQKIYIPFEWDLAGVSKVEVQTLEVKKLEGVIPSATTNSQKAAQVAPEVATVSEKVDINSASAEELDALPGIGPAYAKKIIDNRPYSSRDELFAKSGVAKATLEKIISLVFF